MRLRSFLAPAYVALSACHPSSVEWREQCTEYATVMVLMPRQMAPAGVPISSGLSMQPQQRCVSPKWVCVPGDDGTKLCPANQHVLGGKNG